MFEAFVGGILLFEGVRSLLTGRLPSSDTLLFWAVAIALTMLVFL